ncbi:mechanosensitive ion channel family protein [Aestuariibius sp. 2305UL40-4]|uniref:mechanosensitive ion channel family protein n=1 Tax=Aestuariibius violaceus TaxID=3234132 RepID=UPI00345EDF8E
MENLLNLEIWQGQTVGDLLTLDFLAEIFGNVIAAILILIVGFWIAGLISRRIRRFGETNTRADKTLFAFLGNIARYAILALTFIFVLNTFGVQTTSIVALVGAAGLAIGLALQGTLSNVAAGVMLILFRPIRIGDFIEVNSKMGTVQSLSLNYLELASIANVQVMIPNSEVWANTITNYSTYDKRRAEWTFGVGYDADLKMAQKIILDTIMADPRAHLDPEPWIQVNALNSSSVDFLVRVWCDNADYWNFQADAKRNVKEALDASGITIPFPTRTIYHEGASGEAQVAAAE